MRRTVITVSCFKFLPQNLAGETQKGGRHFDRKTSRLHC